MSQPNSFDDLVNANLESLTKMLAAHEGHEKKDSYKWLEILFKYYSERTLSDNERIWRTGAIFVPISLAAFAAVTGIKCLKFWHTVSLGVPSMSLMFAWIVIAENHRAFQQKSEGWLIAIQKLMNLDQPEPIILRGKGLEQFVRRKGAIQFMRWALLVMVIIAWILIAVFSYVGWLSTQCTT